jgi:hypothetical protein
MWGLSAIHLQKIFFLRSIAIDLAAPARYCPSHCDIHGAMWNTPLCTVFLDQRDKHPLLQYHVVEHPYPNPPSSRERGGSGCFFDTYPR